MITIYKNNEQLNATFGEFQFFEHAKRVWSLENQQMNKLSNC